MPSKSFNMYKAVMKGRFDPEENAKEIRSVNQDEPLSVEEFQTHLLPCERPEGYGSKVYRRQMMVVGQYKVHVSGLDGHGIPNGFYMVREEFATKLLRFPARRKVRTGLMFAGKLITVQEFYETHDHIVIDIPPMREKDSCPGL